MEVEPDTDDVSDYGGPPLVPVTLKKVTLKINMCMGYGEPGDSNGPVHRTVDHAGDLLGAVHNQHPRPIVGHAAADGRVADVQVPTGLSDRKVRLKMIGLPWAGFALHQERRWCFRTILVIYRAGRISAITIDNCWWKACSLLLDTHDSGCGFVSRERRTY